MLTLALAILAVFPGTVVFRLGDMDELPYWAVAAAVAILCLFLLVFLFFWRIQRIALGLDLGGENVLRIAADNEELPAKYRLTEAIYQLVEENAEKLRIKKGRYQLLALMVVLEIDVAFIALTVILAF